METMILFEVQATIIEIQTENEIATWVVLQVKELKPSFRGMDRYVYV